MAETHNTVLADFFKALAHPTRLQILELLRPGERCVCEIFPALEMEQSNVSRHLSVSLEKGGFGAIAERWIKSDLLDQRLPHS